MKTKKIINKLIWEERINVINCLLLDGFTEKQIVDLYAKNKKFEKKLIAYHISRIAKKVKDDNKE